MSNIGLTTLLWIPNFNLKSVVTKYVPKRISFPSLPLEYRDLDLVEAFANQLGIFMKHYLLSYEHTQKIVRVCILDDLSKRAPNKIMIVSKFGSLTQEVVVDDPVILNQHILDLGHFTSQCLALDHNDIQVCEDLFLDPLGCSRSGPSNRTPNSIVIKCLPIMHLEVLYFNIS